MNPNQKIESILSLFILTAAGLLIITSLSMAGSITLNGNWKFAVDTAGAFNIQNVNTSAKWRDAKVPLSWQAQFADLRDYQGVAWYKKTFSFPGMANTQRAIIKFEAVDYISEIYVNGKLAGKHEGGYTPFEFDISPFVKIENNEIIVRVMDPAASEKGTEGISYWHIPHGKQNWYVQTSGIWRDAEIVILPKRAIRKINVSPSVNGEFSADVDLYSSNEEKNNEKISFQIIDPAGKIVFKQDTKIEPDVNKVSFAGKIQNPLLWNLKSPNLYKIEASLENHNNYTDRFGFRSFEAKDKKLYLNGKPFYLIAALDQDFYPESVYTTPSEEYIRDEMLKAKKTGLNMLRCHIKVPDRRYLKIADEIGLLVWYEIPNWDVFTKDAAQRGLETFDEMIYRDWNHPSLVIISLINESWGIDLQKADQREWLKNAFNTSKQKAKGRLVVDNSACWGNFHVKTDINDYHTYYAIPDNRMQFSETVKSVAERPDWLFSKFGDAEQSGNEPILISEFGNWGLPKLPSKLPFWFSRQFLDNEVTLPEGVYKRFNDFHYNDIFNSYDKLAEESQKAQLASLKYEIEQIRLSPEIQGYVITEFTDINWESNGLLDMWRNMKTSAKNISDIQQPDIIIPRPERYTYWNNENAKINLWLSHYSDKALTGSKIIWETSTKQKGNITVNEIKNYNLTELSPVTIPLSIEKSSEKVIINFTLINKNGETAAKNSAEIFIYNHAKPAEMSLNVYDNDGSLKLFSDELNKNGYKQDKKNSSLLISKVLDEEIFKQLEQGVNVLCLIDTNTKAPDNFSFKFKSRKTDLYDGNWISNMNWLRNDHPVLKDISFGKSLGFESAYSSPQVAITGIPAENFQDVLAGMNIGWLYLNSGYIVQTRAGKGKLVLCSFNIIDNYKSDPFASRLLDNLIKYISGNNFNPQLSLNKNK